MIKLVPGLFYNERQSKEELCRFILGTDRLSIGPECEKFERAFAHWQGRQSCVLFNSGSSANLALIQALINLELVKKNNRAGFSAMTWATNVMPLIQLGLTTVPIDVELDTLNISSQTFEKVLKKYPDIKLLFITNLLGFCGDLDRIQQVCKQHRILLIEDNCESLGSVFKGQKLGNWGLASTFSFFVGHHMSTIEGGAVCTDDANLDRMLRLVRAHGWDRNLTDLQRQEIRTQHSVADDFYANFTFYTLGYNLRPTEITGFLGNQQLRFIDVITHNRECNWRRFKVALSANPDFLTLNTTHMSTASAFATPVICRSPELADRYIRAFIAADVEVRPIVGGSIPDQPFYKNLVGETETTPNARTINRQGFYFGNNPELTETEIRTLEHLLRGEAVQRTQAAKAHADVRV